MQTFDEAVHIDAELRAIAKLRQQLHAREVVLLVRAEELAIWRRFGCASFLEYLERTCDLHPRTAREYIRVARALHELPVMRAQLDAERIVYSTARELTRVATPENEAEWLDAVAGMSPREVEEEVAGRKKGDSPRDAKDPDRIIKVTLEMRASTYAQYVERRTQYAADRGEPVTDDETLVALFRPRADDGAPPYQIAITTCRECKKSYQVGGGREIEVPASTAERARCDARNLGDLEEAVPPRALSSVTPRMREHVLARDGFECSVPGCRSKLYLDVHHLEFQSHGGKHSASNLLGLCAGHHAQLHDGKLRITGEAPHALVFEWRDDTQRTSTRETGADLRPVGRCDLTFEDVARAAAAALEQIAPWPSGPKSPQADSLGHRRRHS